MKDYSYLRDKKVTFEHGKGIIFEDCKVAEIDGDIGFTIVGILSHENDIPNFIPDKAGDKVKVYCVDIKKHGKKEFKVGLKQIIRGHINTDDIDEEIGRLGNPFSGGQPACAFE